MKIFLEKLYRYDRVEEPLQVAIPFAKGELKDINALAVLEDGKSLPLQTKVTSSYEDGSVRYAFVRFLANLPGNKGKTLDAVWDGGSYEAFYPSKFQIEVKETQDGLTICNGASEVVLKNHGTHLMESYTQGEISYGAEQFVGPCLRADDCDYTTTYGTWKVIERGDLVTVVENQGSLQGKRALEFVANIKVYANKPWMDVAIRLVNTSASDLHVQSWTFSILDKDQKMEDFKVPAIALTPEGKPAAEYISSKADSTGCGDIALDNSKNPGPYFMTNGIKELPILEEKFDFSKGDHRNTVAHSNYKTTFTMGVNLPVTDVVTAQMLVGEANEHFGEVFYGTFFTDHTTKNGGVCATVFQAQQNFPKAVAADNAGSYVMLVPENVGNVTMASGMAREQRFLLHFHDAKESMKEIDNRSLIYQMPDTPVLDPETFAHAQVMQNIFVPAEQRVDDWEIGLVSRADGHGRAYGMLNWGDFPDPGYTSQGRGKGRPVWTNNEYDYPHSMYMMFARTGIRRFLDYATVAVSHWMDVDVCHYSENPLYLGGQWEHTMGHCKDGVMVCSHQWVEGLIDCYHFTGNERALNTAIGIGENILRLLETPMYQVSGESNARETGWALRTLVALYAETGEERWVKKCRWIIGHFKEWQEEYGEWVAPYTDNTTIRVGFMISVAVGSLMRYYRIFKEEDVKELILSAIDDLVENCTLPTGIFYYKELPSLQRNGNNTLLLESMAIGYELTGDKKYLECGYKTFTREIKEVGNSMSKKIVEDAVLVGNNGTKNFAQCFIPLSFFYKSLLDAGMLAKNE
ncbi:MAG: glycoside hydrolase family 127 protein [Lachnospiraceae bacterium]|nr:glycoside hydrolase family 127 protein [Lachnospiraceae bacterium]